MYCYISKKNKQKNKIITTCRRLKKTYNFFAVIYIVILAFCFITIIYRMINNFSIIGGLFGLTCPIFLRSEVILEVMKVLGFTNILSALVYSKLDEKVQGLTYANILHSTFKHHFWFSIVHVIATLCCVAFAKAHHSETTLFFLLLVIVGFFQQWIVLYSIVLNKSICNRFANDTWKNNLNVIFIDEELENNRTYRGLLSISASFPERHHDYYNNYLESLAIMLYKKSRCVENLDNSIKDMQQIMKCLFANKFVMENQLFLDDLFETLLSIIKNNMEKDTCECLYRNCIMEVVSGMVSGLITLSCNATNKSDIQKEYMTMYEQLTSCAKRISSKEENNDRLKNFLLQYIYCIILAIGWVLFQYGKIELYAISNLPNSINLFENDNYYKEYVIATAKSIEGKAFTDDIINNSDLFRKICENAITQTEK